MRYARLVLLGLVVVAVMAAAGCSDDASQPSVTPSGSVTPGAAASPTSTVTPDATALPTFEASLPEPLLRSMREDVVESLPGVYAVDRPDLLEVVGVVKMASTQDCLPLPKPADCPPEEMVPGYRVTLRRLDFGVDYFYYTDGKEKRSGPWLLPLPAPIPVSPEVLPPALLTLLRDHLANKVGVAPDSIEVATVDEAVWSGCFGLGGGDDAAGPCGPPGYMLGYEITLMADGKEYRYHAMREEPYQFIGPIDTQ